MTGEPGPDHIKFTESEQSHFAAMRTIDDWIKRLRELRDDLIREETAFGNPLLDIALEKVTDPLTSITDELIEKKLLVDTMVQRQIRERLEREGRAEGF